MVEQKTKAACENHGYIPEILNYKGNLQRAKSINRGSHPEKYTNESSHKKPEQVKESFNIALNGKTVDSNEQKGFEKEGDAIQISNPDSTDKEETFGKSTSLEPEENIRGWIVVVAASFLFMIANGTTRCFTILFAKFLEESDSSSSTIAIVVNVFGFFLYGSGLPAGILIRKFGFRSVTFASSCIFFLAIVVSSFVKEVWYLLISYSILAGISCGAFVIISLTSVPNYFSKNKGRAMSLFSLLSYGGAAVLPIGIKLLQEHYGHQGAILIFSGISLNACVAALLFPPTVEHSTPKFKISNACESKESTTACIKYSDVESNKKCLGIAKRRSFHILDNVRKSIVAEFLLFRSARASIIIFGLSFFIVSYYNFSSFLPFVVQEYYCFSLKDAANCTSVSIICETVSRVVVSFLSDFAWFSYKVNMIFSHLLLIASMIAFSLFQETYYILAVSALFGTSIGTLMGTFSLVMLHYVGVANLTSMIGLTTMVISITLIPFGSLAGLLLDLGFGILGYASFFAFLTLVSIVFWLLMPLAIRYDQRKEKTNKNET